MIIDGYELMVDVAAKFFNTLRVYGWFHHPTDKLASVAFSGQPVLASIAAVNISHGGVLDLGPDKGFSLHVMRAEEALSDDAAITFTALSGWSATVRLTELYSDRISRYPGHGLMRRFLDMVNAVPNAEVLDIGGRDRSGNDHSKIFDGAKVTVLDILPGDNVDIVADAHDLSSLPAESFDAIHSVSVFEHLMMPWAVVPQMHRVLRPGGIALVHSHQTIGMHDIPWDFWRFSDAAWDGLFNQRTGFEILERVMEFEQFVIPFVYRPIKADAERSAGYESSTVLIQKTGPCTLTWPVTPKDLTATMYPPGTEDPFAHK